MATLFVRDEVFLVRFGEEESLGATAGTEAAAAHPVGVIFTKLLETGRTLEQAGVVLCLLALVATLFDHLAPLLSCTGLPVRLKYGPPEAAA
jgi:hypothetical protein